MFLTRLLHEAATRPVVKSLTRFKLKNRHVFAADSFSLCYGRCSQDRSYEWLSCPDQRGPHVSNCDEHDLVSSGFSKRGARPHRKISLPRTHAFQGYGPL